MRNERIEIIPILFRPGNTEHWSARYIYKGIELHLTNRSYTKDNSSHNKPQHEYRYEI